MAYFFFPCIRSVRKTEKVLMLSFCTKSNPIDLATRSFFFQQNNCTVTIDCFAEKFTKTAVLFR